MVHAATLVLLMGSTGSSELMQRDGNGTHVLLTNCTNKVASADAVGWDDRDVYVKLAVVFIAIGLLFQCGLFHIFVREPDHNTVAVLYNNNPENDLMVNVASDKINGMTLRVPVR